MPAGKLSTEIYIIEREYQLKTGGEKCENPMNFRYHSHEIQWKFAFFHRTEEKKCLYNDGGSVIAFKSLKVSQI